MDTHLCNSMAVPHLAYKGNKTFPGHNSHHRKKGTLAVEELSEDDIGYDADIEVVHPNQYEDADSGNDNDVEDEGYDTADSEDRLAQRLSHLSCEPKERISNKESKAGKKRMSWEIDSMDTSKEAIRRGRPDLEIEEINIHSDETLPSKRRKKRPTGSQTGERTVPFLSSLANSPERQGMDDEKDSSAYSRPNSAPAAADTPNEDLMDIT